MWRSLQNTPAFPPNVGVFCLSADRLELMDMSVNYVRACFSLQQLQDEIQRTFPGREQNKGFVTGYMAGAYAGNVSGHYVDHRGVAYAYDIGVDIEGDGTGLKPSDAEWLFDYLTEHMHPRFQYAIYRSRIEGNHTDWKADPYIGLSPHNDHIHISIVDVQWGEPSGVSKAVTDSRKSWGIYEAYHGRKPDKPKQDKPKQDKPKSKHANPQLRDKPNKGLFWKTEKGDSLAKIADYYAVTVRDLVQHNNIDNPNVIEPGDYISIPAPLYWFWERGDSIEEVAGYYGMSYSAVARNAGLVGKRPIIGTYSRIY